MALVAFTLLTGAIAKAEFDFVVGANSATMGNLPNGATNDSFTNGQVGILYRRDLSPRVGLGIGTEYRLIGYSYSYNGPPAGSVTYTEGQLTVPFFLSTPISPYFFVFAGGSYWTFTAQNYGFTGSATYTTTAAAYANFPGTGLGPMAGFAIQIQRFIARVEYDFPVAITGGSSPVTASAISLEVGIRTY